MNPSRPEYSLTRGPESFPATLVHPPHETKGLTLKACEDGELFSGWCCLLAIESPKRGAALVTILKGPGTNFRLRTLNVRHQTSDFQLFDREVLGFGMVNDDR
jgi:hypothetical protein